MSTSTISPTAEKTVFSSKFGIATATDIQHQEQQPVLDKTWPSSGTAMTDSDMYHHGVGAEVIGTPQAPIAGGLYSNCSSGYSIVRHRHQLQQLQKKCQRHQN